MRSPRETSAGFHFDAREFLKAAELVLNRAVDVSLPAYFLFSRSIELSLKAFLLQHGVSAKTLRSRTYGHDLDALLREAAKHGLYDRVPLEHPEIGAVEMLSQEYLSARLGYRVTGGTYYLPLIEVTENVARKLVGGLAAVCASNDTNDT